MTEVIKSRYPYFNFFCSLSNSTRSCCTVTKWLMPRHRAPVRLSFLSDHLHGGKRLLDPRPQQALQELSQGHEKAGGRLHQEVKGRAASLPAGGTESTFISLIPPCFHPMSEFLSHMGKSSVEGDGSHAAVWQQASQRIDTAVSKCWSLQFCFHGQRQSE